ncbi:HNH endonuclease signature motif containing protein [Pseudomonas sp. 148P]|uniref:HNH endonuclease signature motif containing protein n=1 Tax=Pseudomonas ulcerans TaxID=3115852 RepID=A0ABU7I0W2_9PSED|nr:MULTISPECIES: HNH endonuclease signature motif containing protein [unclassified Pseudomonas]MEE1926416.1 HNH endonuclease signature motif containing protein [Pseudomonas sp. 147P]MEE1937461.1 HNH endonuclease signature motif containing protein [Pseudomonas sp. 148P]
MAIKAVSKEAIVNAMQVFDTELRGQNEWHAWEQNQSHLYAIDVAGTLYPAKKIVSLATGTPFTQFTGGHQTNSYLEKCGFVVKALPRGANQPAPHFQLGAIYDRKTEINGLFGGNYQNGISKSRSQPAIFIFTGESGEQYGYTDGWNDDHSAYLYTGEGKRGDMTLDGNNLAIAEHAQTGRALYLFKSLGKSKGYRFEGEFSCADIFRRTQLDELKEERSALVFRLVPDGDSSPEQSDEADVKEDAELPKSLEAARQAAIAACTPGATEPGQSAPRKIYQRSRKVAHYVLMRADGICECCLKPAPFLKKDGGYYLEPHHVNRLSDGGLDHPRYVGAICPNCHREIHSGMHGESLNHQLKERLKTIEPE